MIKMLSILQRQRFPSVYKYMYVHMSIENIFSNTASNIDDDVVDYENSILNAYVVYVYVLYTTLHLHNRT